jgi:hypothetical protein
MAHMETFDSDEEYSDDAEIYGNIGSAILDPIDAARYQTKIKVRKFVKPKNVGEILLKLLYVVPIAIALGDYLGFFWSTTLSMMALIMLQLRPPPVESEKGHRMSRKERRMSRRRSSMSTSSVESRRRSSMGWDLSNSFKSLGKNGPKSAASVLDMLEMVKLQVHDCRKETSRLLGLIGAPPLEWKLMESSRMMATSRHKKEIDTSLAGDVSVASAQVINDLSLKCLIKFLEAHAQFLLTVDHAYYWMRVSASLHWGLGPHSQCVERVERAAIAKEFRNNRRQSISGSLISEGISSPLEPQRKLDTSSILSLASTRQNIAQSLIDQSKSLVHAFKLIRELESEQICNVPVDYGYQNALALTAMIDDKILTMPEVVDLTWIKASRRHLAVLLSYTADYYCSIDGLQILSDDADKRSFLDESMLNARNAREYLLCNLLLGKTPTSRPAVEESGAGTDELMLSLLQYREQLEGLNAALWACQQYSKLRRSGFGSEMVLSAADILQQEEEAESSKLAWWNQIKQLSTTCKELEHEMETKFFPSINNDDSDMGAEDDESTSKTGYGLESGEYEHGRTPKNQHAQVVPKATKTKVFSGKGAVEKKPAQTRLGNWAGQESSSTDVPMPPRDTVVEQMLVRELQNRISSLVESLEDDSDNDSNPSENEEDRSKESEFSEEKIEGDSMDRELDDILDRYESFDEDEDADGWEQEERNGEYKNNSNDEEKAVEIADIKPVYVGDVKEREAATSLFLGASGSLLTELKQNLPQGDLTTATLSFEDTAEIMNED